MAIDNLPAEEIAIPADRLTEFWRGIYPEGMTIQKVLDELHDLEILAHNVPKVYDHVTGGRVSKPNTDASVVISLHDDHVSDLMSEAISDDREERETL